MTQLITKIKKKREFRKRKRKAESIWQEEKYEDITKAAELDIGEFFRTVRRMKKQAPSSTKLVYNNGAKSNSDVCKLWGNYLEDLCTEKDDETVDKCFHKEIKKNMRCYFNEKINQNIHTLEKTITEIEIKNQIKTLKIGKSPGQDCISNEHLTLYLRW